MKRVRTIFSGVQGSPYISNMYYGDGTAAQDAVDAVAAFWSIAAEWIVSECSWTVQGEVTLVDPVTGQITGVEAAGGSNGAGLDTNEMLPPATQLLLRWHTGSYVGGRELRGRTFIPAVQSAVNDEGVVLSTVLTEMNSSFETWLVTQPPLLCWSRTHGETRVIVSVDPWEQFAQQRSRRD